MSAYKPGAGLRRHVRVQVEVPLLVLLAGELIVGAGVDDTPDAVPDGSHREVVVALHVDLECLHPVFA